MHSHRLALQCLCLAALAAAAVVSGCANRPGPRESLVIDSQPQGAHVFIAGREIGVTPVKVVLDKVFPRHWTGRTRPDQEAFALVQRRETVELQKEGCELYTHVYAEDELQDDIKVTLQCDPNFKPAARSESEKAQALEQRLRALEELKKKGLVTEEEYSAQRQRILDSM